MKSIESEFILNEFRRQNWGPPQSKVSTLKYFKLNNEWDFLMTNLRISSSDIRQDDFYIDDDIPKSDEGRDFTSGSIAELLGMD